MTCLAAENIFEDSRTLWAAAALVGILLLAAGALALINRWRDRQISGPGDPADDPLTMYREMYDSGEISRDEYERIRAKLATKYYGAARTEPPVVDPDGSDAPDGPGDGASE